MTKQNFVWTLFGEESERVSTDRLQRFKSKKSEKVPNRVKSPTNFYKDTALTFGDIVVLKNGSNNGICVGGQIVNFEFDTKTSKKKDRKFPFSFCILNINENVLIKLSPCVEISRRGYVTPYETKSFFHVNTYCVSVKKNLLNFESARFDRHLLKALKNILL